MNRAIHCGSGSPTRVGSHGAMIRPTRPTSPTATAVMGGTGVEALLSMLVLMIAMVTTVFALQSATTLRADEASGILRLLRGAHQQTLSLLEQAGFVDELRNTRALSVAEIATTLGIKLGTVRSRIHRGRSQLREALAHRAPQPVKAISPPRARRGVALGHVVAGTR